MSDNEITTIKPSKEKWKTQDWIEEDNKLHIHIN